MQFEHAPTAATEKVVDLTAQIEALAHADALTEEQLSFLLQSDHMRLVQRAIELFLRDNSPLPDSLQEHALHLELRAYPYDVDLTRALLALLHKTGRPPLPGLLQVLPSRGLADQSGLEDLLRAGDHHARGGETLYLYAALWQACVRYPQTQRGWAEFGRALADRGEWSSCRVAVDQVLLATSCDKATAKAVLSALSSLAENGELGTLQWRTFVDGLPHPLSSHPFVTKIHLATNNPAKAAGVLRQTVKVWPNDAETWMAASIAACEREDLQEAYDCVRQAFELDPVPPLRAVVGDFGQRFASIVNTLNKNDEIADYLSELAGHHEDLNVVPPWPTPEAKLAVQRFRRTARDRGLPSVLLVTQPKSASTSVGHIFFSGFRLPTIQYSLINVRVISPWLEDYLRGGACSVTHLQPSPRNIELLVASGARSVIVHVRDLRQWVISATEHARLYAGLTLPSERERRRAGFATMLDFVIEGLPDMIGWIEGWVKAREKLTVHFTTFEEFISNRDQFLDRMLLYYGGDVQFFDRENVSHEHPGVDYHRRLGSITEWKTVLTRGQIETINRLIPNEFWKLFGWEP